MKQRVLNMLISFDQFFFSIITLGKSYPDESMSAAAYRAELLGLPARFFRPVIDALFWFDPEHCKKSYESELNRRHSP